WAWLACSGQCGVENVSKKRSKTRRDQHKLAPARVAPSQKETPRPRALLMGSCTFAFLVVLAGLYWATRDGALSRLFASSTPTPVSYVEESSCRQCHQSAAKAWANSHHAKAMAKATAATVLGDFGGVEFEHKAVVSRFFRKGDRYFVHTQGADGKAAD